MDIAYGVLIVLIGCAVGIIIGYLRSVRADIARLEQKLDGIRAKETSNRSS